MRKIKSFFQVIECCGEKRFDEIVDKRVNDFIKENRISNFDVIIGSNHGERAGAHHKHINLILVYSEYVSCKNLSDSLNELRRELKKNE